MEVACHGVAPIIHPVVRYPIGAQVVYVTRDKSDNHGIVQSYADHVYYIVDNLVTNRTDMVLHEQIQPNT